MQVRTAHTSDLEPGELAAIRELLDVVFGDEMTDEDLEHALGGMHALAWDGDVLVGHASVIQRRLLHGGRALRTGYVEAVAVLPDRRRSGIGAAVMAALDPVIDGAFELGALAASDEGLDFYAALGWLPWRGPTSALTPDGLRRTPDEDDGVFVRPVTATLDLDGPIACDWRDGEPW